MSGVPVSKTGTASGSWAKLTDAHREQRLTRVGVKHMKNLILIFCYEGVRMLFYDLITVSVCLHVGKAVMSCGNWWYYPRDQVQASLAYSIN